VDESPESILESLRHECRELLSKDRSLKIDTTDHFCSLKSFTEEQLENVLVNIDIQKNCADKGATESIVFTLLKTLEYFSGFAGENKIVDRIIKNISEDDTLLTNIGEEIQGFGIPIDKGIIPICMKLGKHVFMAFQQRKEG